MQTTSNLGLKKPDQNEYVNVEDLNYNADEMDKLGAPEFDDSGTVSGITSFPAYLTTLMSGTNLFTFFRNLKAGLKFVLHTGQLVNNGQTTEPGFALDARYGKTLADAVTQLNTNLTNLTATNVKYDSTGGSTIATNVQSAIKQIDSSLSKKVTGNLYGLVEINCGRDAINAVTYINFGVSSTLYYQLEMRDSGALVYRKNDNGTWSTIWTK